MTRGPKPTLTIVKQASGSTDRGNFNQNPPKPAANEVERPAFVRDSAAELWNHYAPDLIAKGVLTNWDVEAFAQWCCLAAEFRRDPERMITAKLTQMRLLAEMFGMAGPVSRERMELNSNQSQDPSEKYFA